MLIKKSHERILNLFRKDIFLSMTIRKLSIMLKKDYPSTHAAVKELSAAGIIIVKKVGNAKVCTISLSTLVISVLSFLDEQDALSKKIPNMQEILGFKELADDIILVTGSYAKGIQTKQSDIDLVIITNGKVLEKQKLIETLTALFMPKVHPIVISYADFIVMLLEKRASFAKEVFKNRLVFRNASRYYGLLKEAIENGFRS